jgi:hypothetical protein
MGKDVLGMFGITDGDRQRAFSLWKAIVTNKINDDTLSKEVKVCTSGQFAELKLPEEFSGSQDEAETIKSFFAKLAGTLENLIKQQTVVKGFNRKDFVICWLMGLLGKLDLKDEKEITTFIYSRIWMTDVFGAPIVPLVDDSSNVPLPQKWATVSSSGNFAVFEAGHFKDRHLYLVHLKTRKVIKLTGLGTYNSSPEISPDEQWIFFETNRSGKSDIWRAQLNLEKIMEKVGK